MEEGQRAGNAAQGVRIQGVSKTCLETSVAEGEVVQVAAAGVRVPWEVSRPLLELHSARGQTVIAESVVTQVVDQPVHILGERGQVLEGKNTATAWPHPTPQVTHPPTSTSTPECAPETCEHLT